MRNKKASAVDIFYLMIMLFIGGILFFVGHKAFNSIADEFQSSDLISGSGEGVINTTETMLNTGRLFDYAFFTIFIMLIIGTLLMAYMTEFSPAYVVLFIIVLIIGIFISIQLANAWFEIESASAFSDVQGHYGMTNYILKNLPSMIIIIGILVGVVMYGKYKSGRGDL